MLTPWIRSWPSRPRPWRPALSVALMVALVAVVPALLVPVAHGYAALCERYPIFALLTNHTPPLPLALILSLGFLALVNGGASASVGFLATLRFTHRLRRRADPIPARLGCIGADLGLDGRLTFLVAPEPMACCYGLLQPRIAVTAGLIDRLDDAELAAVLGHERHHLRRRDPLRIFILDAIAAAGFILPVTPILRWRWEARIELAADRAALAIAPPGALAGALLAALGSVPARQPGVAGLTATEARIAHLAGRQPVFPPFPLEAIIVSLGIAVVIVLGLIGLTASSDLVPMVCPLCPRLA